ncbi:MAG: phosphoribosylformylglycinamidine synthase subunit PurQ [Caldithrix sp.]|nr:phosphoribosylformylglycinamidine synthase subunit PurQ [Caldithrix sp.]
MTDGVRALVVTGYGINCEEEMAAAYRMAGAEAKIVHLNEIFSGQYRLQDYQILNFPGGFSFGDDLGAAKVLSNKIKYKKTVRGHYLIDEIGKFISDGNYILGVCNGFQALVKMGILPNIGKNFDQEATITFNNSGRFEDRWVTCGVNPQSESSFLNDLKLLELPVRHGEGKLLFKNEDIARSVVQNHLNTLSYVDEQGKPTPHYPQNPNGSQLNCAGLVDESGQIFGLMPHPEAFLSLYNHPNWGWLKRHQTEPDEEGQGLQIFKNIVQAVAQSEYFVQP